ncbi:MAG: DnaJ domain-containing protein [Clostridia bacterium]|nr:DnaJ domain-containing protein [Clostridia bacterium]
MKTPFAVLGLDASATAEDVRNAYRQMVKTCHPDRFLDPVERAAAQEKMIALNLAYEEALKLTASRRTVVENYTKELSQEEALTLAAKMLRRESPESALRHLMRSTQRDGRWYAMQGTILMAMDQYETAHQSYREAVRHEPDNNEFRRGALEAAVALKKSRTLWGRIRLMWRRQRRRRR